MTRIKNSFVRNHFCADYIEDISNGWEAVRTAVLNARRVLTQPAAFPNADFDYLERLDQEGTSVLLGAPIQYLV